MAERGVMNSRTRLKLTLGATVFLVVTTFVSIARGMEGVATTCVAGVMTILSTYIWAETRRPSRGWRAGGYQGGSYPGENYEPGEYHTDNYQTGDYHTDNYPDQGHTADDYPIQENPNHTNSNYNHKQRVKHHQGGRHVQDDYG
jgi:hypothetical protein